MGPIRSMSTAQTAIAWRLFELNWIPLGGMGAALALCLMLTDFSLEPLGAATSFGVAMLYAVLAYRNPKATPRDIKVAFVLGSTAQIVLVTMLMTPLTYVAAAAHFPMRDADLFAIDRALGLDWRAYVDFVDAHPALAAALHCGYAMIRWPIFAIPIALAVVARFDRLQEFTLAFGLALIATTVASAFVPAIGAFHHLGLDPADFPHLNPLGYLDELRVLPPVREGALRALDLFGLTGVVTFPSFHAASALLYGWALWPARWMRPVAIAANGLMLASTPIDGGHYFIDVLAGIAVALAAIAAAHAARRALERRIGAAIPAGAGVPATLAAGQAATLQLGQR
jgi:PAP2 superfamily